MSQVLPSLGLAAALLAGCGSPEPPELPHAPPEIYQVAEQAVPEATPMPVTVPVPGVEGEPTSPEVELAVDAAPATEVPAAPAPEVPAAPAPEVPAAPAPEVPATPAPEVPTAPAPEVPTAPAEVQ